MWTGVACFPMPLELFHEPSAQNGGRQRENSDTQYGQHGRHKLAQYRNRANISISRFYRRLVLRLKPEFLF
jgi:hypothetical protein